MDSTLARVPVHLRRHVVEQDYSAYDSISQAVWRFVVLHTHAKLLHTAHSSYAGGFEQTGMSVDRIPKIDEMNARMARFGWGAVCVDGFIPPRAFVEFQSLGILPIAADIRSLKHLAYTPAPDIIHEAAGHAPILIDGELASFIRKIGEAGTRAFTLPEDALVYRAIYTLSEVKEDPGSTPDQIAQAHAALDRAVARATRVSEATKLARLYWWTAEYGLVGTPHDYKLYGAGLLSSLWESQSCHAPEVQKLPLSPACSDVSYDITRPQPQLFVAESFAALGDVLDPVTRDFGYRRGGGVALERAVRSEEIATIQLDSGTQVSGLVTQFGSIGEKPTWVQLSGRVAFYRHDEPLLWRGVALEAQDYRFPVGRITGLREAGARHGNAIALQRAHGQVVLEYEHGARLSGTIADRIFAADGTLVALVFTECTIQVPERPPVHDSGPYPLIFGDGLTAFAGAAHPSHHLTDTTPERILVPRPRQRAPEEQALQRLYDEALEAWRGTTGTRLIHAFSAVHAALQRYFPEEWLLRWNLLESLTKLGHAGELTSTLEAELDALELRFHNREPIATGLRLLLGNKRRTH